MVRLARLLAALPDQGMKGNIQPDALVAGITSDSRQVKPGFIFVALRGEKEDGHSFIQDAAARGCLAVVAEGEPAGSSEVPYVQVANSHRAYGLLAAEFNGHPARNLFVVGITGTNGKTTTSAIIEQLIRSSGGSAGVIGTVNYRYRNAAGEAIEREAPLTTPEPMQLHGLLREMGEAGVSHVIIEASSHALVQERLAGLLVDVAVFTNLSRDHLDYHHSMEEYFASKQLLFDRYLKPSGTAVVNLEETGGRPEREGWGRKLVRHLGRQGMHPHAGQTREKSYITCGFDQDCMVRAENIKLGRDALSCSIILPGDEMTIKTELTGKHNVSNLLSASAVGLAMQYEPAQIALGLQQAAHIPGRLERVQPAGQQKRQGPACFVDYAHTPDALEQVLRSLRQVTAGSLCCVFGCGGDRDRGKRKIMGQVAARLADRVVITSDNPRSEWPEEILAEIEEGLRSEGRRKRDAAELFALSAGSKGYAVIENRSEAIHQACCRSAGEDTVLVAGKGHETYQITAAGRRFFDDRLEIRNSGIRWTLEHLLAATSGELAARGREDLFGEISTDTRRVRVNDVFIALRGEKFDGHDYIEEAVAKGAAAVIVEDQRAGAGVGGGVTCILVQDTLQALGDLAGYRRGLLAPSVRIIAITGSSGKTTVKEMTAAIFGQHFAGNQGEPVLKTQGNFNNLVGLPLTLLQLNAGHRVAVLEMGMNRPGEIQRLTEIADPDIGCITNVQAAHLEGLGTIAGVARAKGELFAEMRSDGVQVINLDDSNIRAMAEKSGGSTVRFAVHASGRRHHPDVRVTRVANLGLQGMRFTLQSGSWKKRITVPAVGEHNVANCAAAAAIATAADIGPDDIAAGLGRFRSGDKRLQIEALPGGIHVVNDSYNANPASMAAALRTVIHLGDDCRIIALLGDMFELGAGAPEAHGRIGRLVGELGYDFLGVTGEYADIVVKAAVEAGMQGTHARKWDDKAAMADWIIGLVGRQEITSDDWILIKGSRGMRMEEVAQALHNGLLSERN